MEAELIYIGLAAVFGIFMAWGIGANDVANAMATSVGSKALTIKQAILVAAIFEFLGAVLAGGEVTSTIRKGIVDSNLLAGTPELLVFGMLASLLAAGTWLEGRAYFRANDIDTFNADAADFDACGAPADTGLAKPTPTVYHTSNATPQSKATGAVQNVGGSRSHSNLMPFLCINFIVALVGIYPSRH